MTRRFKSRTAKFAPAIAVAAIAPPPARSARGRSFVGQLFAAVSLAALCAGASLGARAAPTPEAVTASGQELQVDLRSRLVQRVERAAISGETFTTSSSETLEVLLADGGSLALGPDTQVLVDEFRYDPATRQGVLRLQVLRGGVRVMGGLGNSGAPIQVSIASASFELFNGGAFFAADGDSTRAALLVGERLVARLGDQTRTIERVGFEQVIGAGRFQNGPRRQSPDAAFADAARVNPALRRTGGTVLVQVDEGDAGERRQNTQTGNARPEPRRFDPNRDPRDGGRGGGVTFAGGTGQPLSVQISNGSGNAQFVQILRDVLAQSQSQVSGNGSVLQRSFRVRDTDGVYILTGNATPIVQSRSLALATFGALSNPIDGNTGFSVSPCELLATGGGDPCVSDPRFRALLDLWFEEPLDLKIYVAGGDNPTWGGIADSDITAGNSLPFRQYITIQTILSGSDWLGVAENNGRRLSGISASEILPASATARIATDNADIVFTPFERRALTLNVLKAGVSGTRGNYVFGPDNFFYFENQPAANADTIVYAQGNLQARDQSNAGRIDTYVVGRGLNSADWAADGKPRDPAAAQAFRSFLPGTGSFNGAAFASSPLWVINGAGLTDNAFLQTDFAVSGDGTISAISTTMGQLAYLTGGGAKINGGRTIGSQRANNGSTQLSSPVLASAVGGGNPALTAPGAAGYLVLENVVTGQPGGGVVKPIGEAQQPNQFGYLRLASAVSSAQRSTTPVASTWRGFVAGLVEGEASAAGAVSLRLLSGGIELTPNTTTNTLAATVTASDGGGADETIALGGSQLSAFVDQSRFAARSSDTASHEAALVSGGAVFGGLQPLIASYNSGKSAEAQVFGGLNGPSNGQYQHLQWGFFFGDLTKSGPRRHTHLASWAAAAPMQRDLAQSAVQGSVSFRGHAIGTVLDNGARRLGLGTFTQSWNLAAQTGAMGLSFDNRDYTGVDMRLDNNWTYTGQFIRAGQDPFADRTGQFNGAMGAPDAAGKPRATFGQFLIQNGTYTATGTFGGETPATGN